MRKTIFAAMAAAMAMVLGVAAPASAKWEDARNPEQAGDWFGTTQSFPEHRGPRSGSGTADNTIRWKIQIKCPRASSSW